MASCPFDMRLDQSMGHAQTRVANGQVDPRHFKPELRGLAPEGVLAELHGSRPGGEALVVTHGDHCPANILFRGGVLAGFVDLGQLGVADRWRDLAVATWSLDWNVSPGWQHEFLDAYGVELDPARMRFYRLLYELN